MTTDTLRADDLRMDVGALMGAVLARWLRIVAVTLVLMAAAYAVLMVTPRMYESSSSLLVEARDNAFIGPATATGTSSGGAATTIDALVSSQVELIKSRDALLAVVDQLNLRSVPEFNGTGPNPFNLVFQLIGRKPEPRSVDDTVLGNLNDRLTVIRERDSAIVSIFVRSQSPELAADIANAIAAEHVKRRAQQSITDTAEASAWLEQEIVKLRRRVADAETAVAKFRADNDLFEGANNTSLVDQQLTALATQITAAQERRNAARSRAALIGRMIDAGQPIDGLADVQNSAVIQRLSQSKADLQGQLAERSSTLLPNHPTMRALTAQIREIDRQIATEGRRVAASLESEAQIEADLEASLQDELARLKASAANAATHGVTLDELQREAKAQRDLLESYLLRYRDALSRADSASALPDVRIVTTAAPSATPASPKTGLLLAAIGIGAVALQVGAIVFGELLSGRAVIEGARPVALRPEPDVVEEPAQPLAAAAAVGADRGAATGTATFPRERRRWFGSRRQDRKEHDPAVAAVETVTEPAAEPVAAAVDTAPPAATEATPFAPIPEPVARATATEEHQPEPAAQAVRPARRGLFDRLVAARRPRPAQQAAAAEDAAVAAVASAGTAAPEAATEPAPSPAPVTSGPADDAAATAVAQGPREAGDASAAIDDLDEPLPAEPARRAGWLARIWGRGARRAGPREEPGMERADEIPATPETAAVTEAPAAVEPKPEPVVAAAEPAAPVASVGEGAAEPPAGIADDHPEEPWQEVAEDVQTAPATADDERAAAMSDDLRDSGSLYPSALATLGADIALGRVRVVLVAGLESADDCPPVAEALVSQALRAGLSVVRVDAGSGEVSSEPGVTDLAAERASFGDVVHKGAREGLSEVPWGHQVALNRRSPKPNTLVEALTDIYEVVVVMTGRVGMSSSLPMFRGIAGRLVLASPARADADHVEAALAETAALGFRQAQVIAAPSLRAEVA